eukprot:1785759-Ditylum_brightwellii.AAC.1
MKRAIEPKYTDCRHNDNCKDVQYWSITAVYQYQYPASLSTAYNIGSPLSAHCIFSATTVDAVVALVLAAI